MFDANAAPAQERIPNPEPLNAVDVLEDRFEHVALINRDEAALASQREAMRNAFIDARSLLDLERADVALKQLANERSERPSAKLAERYEKQNAALMAKRKANDDNYKRQMDTTPGPATNILRDWYNSPKAHLPYEHAQTPTDIREGESASDANTRLIAEFRALIEERKDIARAPIPAAEITQACYAYVGKLAEKAPMGSTLSALRLVAYDEARDSFRYRSPSIPTDPAGMVGLIAALLPDALAGALAAAALENHDEARALDAVARSERLAAINARLLEIQYTTEANHRAARARGESAGMRIASNPLAILDLVEA